jgi:mevalonate kinase
MSGGKNTIRPFKCGKPLLLVVVDTGIKHSTKEAVDDVRKRKEADPAKYEKIFSEAKAIVTKAKKELQFSGMNELGKLMKQNQKLLVEMGVSCKEIDEIVKLAEVSGATGAKLTGAGMGGNVILLCENAAQQDKMINLMQQRNYKAMKVKIQ